MGRRAAPVSRHVRAYRRLLSLYPAAFRAEYGNEMTQLFADQLRDARRAGGIAPVARLWLVAAADVLVTAPGLHLRREEPVPRPVEGALGAAGGVGQDRAASVGALLLEILGLLFVGLGVVKWLSDGVTSGVPFAVGIPPLLAAGLGLRRPSPATYSVGAAVAGVWGLFLTAMAYPDRWPYFAIGGAFCLAAVLLIVAAVRARPCTRRTWMLASLLPASTFILLSVVKPGFVASIFDAPVAFLGYPLGPLLILVAMGWMGLGLLALRAWRSKGGGVAALLLFTVPATLVVVLAPVAVLTIVNLAG